MLAFPNFFFLCPKGGYILNDDLSSETMNAGLTMDLSVLCGDGLLVDGMHASTGYSPSDLERWSAPLRTSRLQWIQAVSGITEVFTFGMLAIDPVRDRAIQVCTAHEEKARSCPVVPTRLALLPQYGGTPALLLSQNLDCFTLDLQALQWGNDGQPEPSCSYGVTWVGPFFLWGTAYVVLPERRQALMFGGRQSPPLFTSRFNVLDGHWALDLDDLTWEYLASEELFWGLPLISGERWC